MTDLILDFEIYLKERYNKYKEIKHQEYLTYLENYPSFDERTNQEIGLEYYERLVALKTDSIIHNDLPVEFWNHVLKKYDIKRVSFYKDRYTRDIGGDFYCLLKNVIGQAKYYHGNSNITYDHLSHVTQAAIFYGINNFILAHPTESKVHHMARDFVLILPNWKEEIIDVQDFDSERYKTIEPINDENEDESEYCMRSWQDECGQIINSEQIVNIQAPPGSGKGNLIIHYLEDVECEKDKHLFIVPRIDLATQMKKRFEKYEQCKKYKIYIVGDNKELPKTFNKTNKAIVICLIQSIDKIREIHFNTVWKDEAHLFQNTNIQDIESEKYIQMSATMPDDIELNYKYSLTKAIQDEIISDYRLGIVYITKGDVMEASCNYVCEHPELYPVQVFCNSQNRVREAYKMINKYVPKGGRKKPVVKIVLGEMKSNQKEKVRLGIENGEVDIIVVCQCFSVGTDMKRLKTTFMLDKKTSKQSLVQASLRCLRKHESKAYGNIFIPIYHKESDSYSPEDSKQLAFLISCLQEEDDRLNDKNFMRCITQVDTDRQQFVNEQEEEQGEYLYDEFYDAYRGSTLKKVEAFLNVMKERTKLISGNNKELKFEDGILMGNFWSSCKIYKRCQKEPYNKLLENSILRQDYERYCEASKNKSKIKVTLEEKVEAFLKEMEGRTKLIPCNDKELKFEDGSLMGSFWKDCEKKKRCENEPYNKLLENSILRQDYERYCEKSKNKSKIKVTLEEKVEAFLNVMNGRTKLIPCEDKKLKFEDGSVMGRFWSSCKIFERCQKDPYNKLLENDILRQDYDRYCEASKIKLTTDEKVEVLLNVMKEKTKLIPYNKELKFEDGSLIGVFWFGCKKNKRCENTPYNKLLGNDILCQDYERYCEKESKPKIKLTIYEKVEALLKEMKVRDKLIQDSDKELLFEDGSFMGSFWSNCKYLKKCEKEPYNKLLENDILRQDYDRYCKASKNKPRKNIT